VCLVGLYSSRFYSITEGEENKIPVVMFDDV